MRQIALILGFLLLTSPSIAQHHDSTSSRQTGPVDLGTINFPTSGPPEAQKHFIEGVLLLHSFEYPRARRAFAEASRLAPDFAMAYWGEAMTYDHPIWGERDRGAAIAALNRLAPTAAERKSKAATEREKMYLDAVEKLYSDQVAAAYSSAMADLVKRFPDDLEAQAFYSLSILGLTGSVRNTENYMKAAAVAEAIYKKNPKHPGALHYLIHAYDDPVNATKGLTAARAYGTVARGASHAQHMPSHIFFALGMWEDSIASNTASMKTARDEGVGGYHPLHWLVYAYLQLGRTEEAAKLIAILEEDIKTKPSGPARRHLAVSRATFLVETRGAGAPSLMEPADRTGPTPQIALASHDLAIGLEHVRRKDLAGAASALELLVSRKATVKSGLAPEASGSYSAAVQIDLETMSVMEAILAAAMAFAQDERESGIRNTLAAAAREDKLVFEFGPPIIVKPTWEAAGELLLAAGRKKEAADAFRNALKRYPNRRLSTEGLAAATAR
jgi:tetratricopeptide (TPR) repeat protein